VPVDRYPDHNYPQSEQLLQRLGAVRIGSCAQGEVYQWLQ